MRPHVVGIWQFAMFTRKISIPVKRSQESNAAKGTDNPGGQVHNCIQIYKTTRMLISIGCNNAVPPCHNHFTMFHVTEGIIIAALTPNSRACLKGDETSSVTWGTRERILGLRLGLLVLSNNLEYHLSLRQLWKTHWKAYVLEEKYFWYRYSCITLSDEETTADSVHPPL